MAKDVVYKDPSRQDGPPQYEDHETTAEYINSLQPIQEQKRKVRRQRILIGIVCLVIVAGVGAYFLFLKPSAKPQQQTQTPATQTETMPIEQVGTKKYSSTDLNISFDYPANWQIHDDTQGLVTVESPVVKIKGDDGQQADAKVVLSFLAAGSEVPGFKDASATAALDSEKITYSAPSQNQRKQTYLSFAGFKSTGLDAVYVTGDSGYKKDQGIPKTDVAKIEPIISVRFFRCQGVGQCAGEGSGALTIDSGEWQTNQILRAAQKTLESLRVE